MPLLAALCFVATAQTITKPVEVPFRIGETAIIVDAKVNSRPVSLMFDTGFGGSVLVNNTIDLGKATGSMTLRDFVGEMQVPTVKIRSLLLGEMKIDLKDSDAVLNTPSDYSEAYGTHCDFIMGFEVIKNQITEINFQNKKFIFHPKSLDITKRVPDNKRTFLAKLLPIGHNSMEMEVTTPEGKTMILALDTGNSFYATTHRDVLERVSLWDSAKTPKFTRLSGVASGAVDSWSYKMPPLSIFGVPVKETVWDIIDLPSSSAEADGTVGFGFLSKFNITVDYERRRVWLENFEQPIEGAPVGDIGLSAAYYQAKKRVLVARVSPESPADKAGIKVGDSLLGIDDMDLAAISYKKLRRLLEGPVGSKVRISYSHNGNYKKVEIQREALVN